MSSAKGAHPSASAQSRTGAGLNASTSAASPSQPGSTNRDVSAANGAKPSLPGPLTEVARARAYAEQLPSLREVPLSEKQALFVKKLHLCAYSFDFSDTTFMREKEIKRQTLIELVDYVSNGPGRFNEAVAEDVVFMISSNLFRGLPPSRSAEGDSYDPDEEEPVLDPSWPHLQLVYEFLLRYVVSNDTDAKVAKRYIDQVFILRLLDLFDSEDPRERDYLKTILHRVYGKFMVHRPFVRKAINNVFYRFVFETERHNGVAELLEILGSIINGFALPLKEEHKVFLERALMPLHKPKCVALYHQQLAYCVTQFVEKDPKLGELVIRQLLKFWPVTNSSKEVLFLGEMEEILELTQDAEFVKVMVPLFKRIALCLNSQHFQVAERSLFLYNNEYIVNLVAAHRAEVLPVVFPALERNARSHWNAAVHGLTCNVRKMFMEMDPPLYDRCRVQFERDEVQEKTRRERLDAQWAKMETTAAKMTATRHQTAAAR